MKKVINKAETLRVAPGLQGGKAGKDRGSVYVTRVPIFNSSILNDGYCLHRNEQAENVSACVHLGCMCMFWCMLLHSF